MDKATIVRWLSDLELGVEDIEATQGVEWAIITEPHPFRVVVERPAVEWAQLVMQVNLGISPVHVDPFVALPTENRDGFLIDLRLHLNALPVGHRLIFEEKSDPSTLQGVQFLLNLFEEQVTRAGFFRRHHQLQSAGRSASLMFQKLALYERWPV